MTETMGFSLTEVSRLLRRRFDQRAREIGVTRPQWHTLFIIKRNEGINQGGLADLMEIEPITACRMIDRLEEAGLVERRADPDDRRMRRLHLTDAARPLMAELSEIGHDVLAESMEGLSAAQREELTGSLAIMRANLSRSTDPAPKEAANG